jgi:hypothetical protein
MSTNTNTILHAPLPRYSAHMKTDSLTQFLPTDCRFCTISWRNTEKKKKETGKDIQKSPVVVVLPIMELPTLDDQFLTDMLRSGIENLQDKLVATIYKEWDDGTAPPSEFSDILDEETIGYAAIRHLYLNKEDGRKAGRLSQEMVDSVFTNHLRPILETILLSHPQLGGNAMEDARKKHLTSEAQKWRLLASNDKKPDEAQAIKMLSFLEKHPLMNDRAYDLMCKRAKRIIDNHRALAAINETASILDMIG